MNWKLFITTCASAAIIAFPQNIIGCGPGVDPYDYYTSFFHQNTPANTTYKPFYYTGYNFLYDDQEPVETTDLLASEWAAYCNNGVTPADAKKLVTRFAGKDLNNLYYHLEKAQPLKIPDSVKRNSMTDYFMKTKDLEALGYVLYAKQVEPYMLGEAGNWDAIVRDSIKMAKLIKNGQQLYNVAKKDFFKTKFAYQVLRLAHYSDRYADVIKWYDEYEPSINKENVLAPLCLSLKAGALFRTGRSQEATLLFSKTFSATTAKRISNYLGFNWSVDSKRSREEYLNLCKTDKEKANLLALFALGSAKNELPTIKTIYKLDPQNEVLEVLAVREINKMEEGYLTPALSKENGGKTFYYSWGVENQDSVFDEAKKETKQLATELHKMAQGNTAGAGLFETGAAYASYLVKDYRSAKEYAAKATQLKLAEKVKDQLTLTNLLVTINEKETIDSKFEEEILPSIKWLEGKATSEKSIKVNNMDQVRQWRNFYRNLMSEILAKRYHKQGQLDKETLVIGAADWIMGGRVQDPDVDYYYSTSNGIEFLRNSLLSSDVEKLYALMNSKTANSFENYLISHNQVKLADVTDFAGTAYLRDRNYTKAIEWFKKPTAKKTTIIKTNPFIDLLYDREEALPSEKKFTTTKPAFAEEMLRLEKLAATDKINAAKHYYKIALGLYNTTYYGHAWQLVKYYRSSSDGYFIPKNATAFEKEYYGCFEAQSYFEKAMAASTDKNFKARCLFMMAKCSQKQIPQPQYDAYGSNYDQYEAATKKYYEVFMKNTYFPIFVKEYGNTAFYKEAFNSCSYLRDFVTKK